MSRPAWAWIKDLGFDEEGYQRKEACHAIVECPRCGKEVKCVADTEAWTRKGRRWVHSEYGPAQGVCCDLLIVRSFEGLQAYHLSTETST